MHVNSVDVHLIINIIPATRLLHRQGLIIIPLHPPAIHLVHVGPTTKTRHATQANVACFKVCMEASGESEGPIADSGTGGVSRGHDEGVARHGAVVVGDGEGHAEGALIVDSHLQHKTKPVTAFIIYTSIGITDIVTTAPFRPHRPRLLIVRQLQRRLINITNTNNTPIDTYFITSPIFSLANPCSFSFPLSANWGKAMGMPPRQQTVYVHNNNK